MAAAGDAVELMRPLLISPRSKIIISGSSCELVFCQGDCLNWLLGGIVSRKPVLKGSSFSTPWLKSFLSLPLTSDSERNICLLATARLFARHQ